MKLIDLHCDTVMRMYMDKNQGLLKNSYHVDIEKLKKSNSAAQFFALFVEAKEAEALGILPWDQMQQMYQVFMEQLQLNEEHIALAKTAEDLELNMMLNKLSAFLTIEEGGVLDGQIDRLSQVYDMGVRLITLTWNYPNSLGFPNGMNSMEHEHKGLTPFGFEVVEGMNHKGMLVDVSHLSDKGFYDVASASKMPFVASHSNARELRGHGRNLTDDMLRTLGNKGGITGINFCGYFLQTDGDSTVDAMVKHIDHIVNKAGIETVAMGTDFDGIEGTLEIENIGQMNKLQQALLKHGYTEDQIDKIWFQNAYRVIKDVLR